ncbi:ABC transporter C-terminal domain-containing protein, partial [Acinetobacter baumannii]|uniref:ABC transporter C-terminal domain-containing protein n=1 Tax=Acinetobacter baumannii TaxID=470 RepID=UPI000AA3DAF9
LRKLADSKKAVPKEKTEVVAREKKEKPRKLSYKEKTEFETIEQDIAALEERSETLAREMTQAGSDYGKIADLTREKEQVDAELEAKVERWTELSLLVE